jgi:hypothetical protein
VGIALVVMGGASALATALEASTGDPGDPSLVELFLNWVVPIVVVAATLRLTATYPDRARRRAVGAAGAAGAAQDRPGPA